MKKLLLAIIMTPIIAFAGSKQYVVVDVEKNFRVEEVPLNTCRFNVTTTYSNNNCGFFMNPVKMPDDGYIIYVERIEDKAKFDFVSNKKYEKGTLLNITNTNE